MSFADDNLEQTELAPQTSNPYRTPRSGGRKLAPLVLLCALVVGGGIIAYRYMGSGDGPGPQAASAGPAKPNSVPAPAQPKARPKPAEWGNPAFKNLTPQAANAMRAKIAAAAVSSFLSAGDEIGEFTAWLDSLPAASAKPEDPPEADTKTPEPQEPKAPAPPAPPRPIALAPGVAPGAFKLSGVMSNGSNSMAVINGGVYRVGQKVSGAVVESISPKQVVLKIGDDKFWVGM